MKKTTILIVALVIVVLAVVVAVAVDGNQASAFPGSSAFTTGCKTCHGTGTAKFPHTVQAHSYPTSPCANCHTGAPGAGTADLNKCAGALCHVSAVAIAAKPTHSGAGCASASCHASTTTTTAASTTTTAAPTTTTTGGSTTTTAPPVTTSTTAAPTTTTTIPEGEPTFTG